MLIRTRQSENNPNRGVVVVLFALILPCMIGLMALIVDGGIVMSSHRKLQNASDTVALSVANRFFRGVSQSDCLTYAQELRTTNFSSSSPVSWNRGTIDTINNPPLTGPYAGNPKFIEVVLSAPFPRVFSGVFGTGNHRFTARSVAGMESHVTGEGVITIDPCINPGLSISGGSQLIVEGAVICNSGGAGYDQNNFWVNLGIQQYGVSVSSNGTLKSEMALIRGGVDNVNYFQNYVSESPNPLYANIRSIFPDPYRNMPVPTKTNTASITDWKNKKSASIGTGQTVTLTPGIYEDISITGSPNVTFSPGTYIFSPKTPNQGLRINGSPTVTGNNVLFYFTGSNYLDVSPGYWDTLDGALDGPLSTGNSCTLPTAPDTNFNKVNFATLDINLNDATASFTGIQDAASPFNNFLFFHRRRNTTNVQIQSNAGSSVFLKGSIYAKWANFKVAGAGRFESQFTVGSLVVTGGGQVIIEKYGRNFNMAGFIYLVE
jgi:hypothetical protein